jgi:hypothetical protein
LRQAKRIANLKQLLSEPCGSLTRVAHQDFSPDETIKFARCLTLVTTVTKVALPFVVAKKMQPFCFVATLITRENMRVS